MVKKITVSDFFEKAKSIHKNKYSYGFVKSISYKEKIKIICPIHGVFNQRYTDHLRGKNCPKCADINRSLSRRISQDDCIDRFTKAHKNRYSYDKVVYVKSKIPVTIICKIHGEFEQKPELHWKGYGCRDCARNKPKNTKICIKEFINVHGDTYDYSKVEYDNYHSKVVIICPKHGEFRQIPLNHIKGKGCPACSKNKPLTTKECITKFNIIHNNRYLYDKFIYTKSSNYSVITCPIHGDFEQIINNHMRGHGCNKCSNSISNKETRWLDLLCIKKENRQVSLPGLPKRWKVDGYDPETSTVYEFYGDFWHGNLNKYNGSDINVVMNKPFSKLYTDTKVREKKILKAGYNVVTIWESDFN